MGVPVLERGIRRKISPTAEGIQVLTGESVAVFDSRQRQVWADQVHTGLGRHRKYMYQPSKSALLASMDGGDFILAVDQSGLVRATSHLRVAKDDVSRRELGGVVRLDNEPQSKGLGTVVVEAGAALAMDVKGAAGVDLLVAQENKIGQPFFRGLPGIVDTRRSRPSDYVFDEHGEPLIMDIFDATNVGVISGKV